MSEKNFRIKVGLSVENVQVIDAQRNITANTGTFTSVTTPSVTAPTNDLTFNAISTGNINLNTPNGTAFKVLPVTLASSNWLQVRNPATTVVQLGSAGTSICELRLHAQSFLNFYTGSSTDGLSVGSKQAQVSHTASAVNYIDLTGSATTKEPIISAQGSDADISLAFQPKGTGAIDLAAGSSGVNISNGGTVTAVTRTVAGVGYTTAPTWSASAPTTAGGVTATGTTTLLLYSPVINNSGTGYTVGNTLTVVGGSFSPNAASLTVTSVSGGVITGVSIAAGGTYTATPTYPASVTGGSGSSATFTLSAGIGTGLLISNAGSGYIEQPTVTFSGGGGSSAAAYATVGSATVFRSLANMGVFTGAGQQFGVLDSVAISTAYWNAVGGAGTADLRTNSGATGGAFISNGAASNINFRTNINSAPATQLVVSHTASAVNYVQVTGSATGAAASSLGGLSFTGSDGNPNFAIGTKGTGYLAFYGGSTTNLQAFRINTTNAAAAGNLIQVQGAAAGSSPSIQSISGPSGSDANIDLTLTPKGTGSVVATAPIKAQGYTVATLPTAGTIGRIAYVTDATSPTYLGTLTGGGSVKTPVFDNGTDWVSF